MSMMIRNLLDLSMHLGCAETVASISRRLYKDTECGISFWADRTSVSVAGYAEGTDAECQPYVLTFPFTDTEFDKAVENADAEGCLLFDETHCSECGAEVPTAYCDCFAADCHGCEPGCPGDEAHLDGFCSRAKAEDDPCTVCGGKLVGVRSIEDGRCPECLPSEARS